VFDTIVAFVPSHDLARSRDFYEGALGMRVVDVNDFALVLLSGETTVRVTLAENWSPQPFTVLGWTVADAAEVSDRLASAGVALLRYDGMGQDERGLWTTPTGARVAWFADPDGNVLSVTQLPEG